MNLMQGRQNLEVKKLVQAPRLQHYELSLPQKQKILAQHLVHGYGGAAQLHQTSHFC